jgi:hypothetical protein
MLKRLCGGDGVYSAESPAHDQQIVEIVELRCVSALAWIKGKTEVSEMKKTFSAFVEHWGDDRQLMFHQLKTELVLFQNLLVTPTFGSVELGDQWTSIFDAYLVDAILVAVQGKSAAIAKKSATLDGIHDETGCQGFEVVLALCFSHVSRYLIS